jgi:hypothetical protein
MDARPLPLGEPNVPAPRDPQPGRAGTSLFLPLLARCARFAGSGRLFWGAEPPKPPTCRFAASLFVAGLYEEVGYRVDHQAGQGSYYCSVYSDELEISAYLQLDLP